MAIDCQLTVELRLSNDIPCEEGIVIAVEVLNDKANYNQLELVSGRMSLLKQGDIVVGALGHRQALFGYSGHVPKSLRPGDTVQILNIGGVLGHCDSADPARGAPFDCKVLGTVLSFPYLGERIGIPARVGAIELAEDLELNTRGIPVVAIAGTCMDSGKTAAACAIVRHLRHQKLVVDAFKATGVAARRDIHAMADAGARETMYFTDFGVVTTTAENGPRVTKAMIHQLAEGKPDVILFELGDGLLGTYGVEAILQDPDIGRSLTAVVLCANDPVAALGGIELLRKKFDIRTVAVTGPATDNAVGVDIIKHRLETEAANAITDGPILGEIVLHQLQNKRTPRTSGKAHFKMVQR